MRRSLVLGTVLALLASVVLAAPAFAAEGGQGGGAGLLSVDWFVAVATIVVFGLLLFVLSKTAWKPILSGLKAREDGIRAQIEGAEKANAEAKALLAEYQGKLTKATDEARAIVEEGRRDAEALKARIEGDAKAEAARERDRALRDIELARAQALKDIYDEVASLSTDVAGRILGERLDPKSHRRLVDDAVTAYERTRKAPGGRA